VLAEASGTHAVHQNVKLMVSGAKIYDLTEKQIKP
jgi:hypothetical protein